MGAQGKTREMLLFLASVVFIWLILAGIGGISYEIFRDDSAIAKSGWKFLGYLWEKPVMLIPVALGAMVIGYLWKRGDINPDRKHPPFITFLIFIMVCAGAYYTFKIISF